MVIVAEREGHTAGVVDVESEKGPGAAHHNFDALHKQRRYANLHDAENKHPFYLYAVPFVYGVDEKGRVNGIEEISAGMGDEIHGVCQAYVLHAHFSEVQNQSLTSAYKGGKQNQRNSERRETYT